MSNSYKGCWIYIGTYIINPAIRDPLNGPYNRISFRMTAMLRFENDTHL